MKIKYCLHIALSLLSLQAYGAAFSPEAIIKKVDDIRNPGDSYGMKVEITGSESEDKSVYEVSIQGNDKTLIKTLEPPRDRGHNMLMLQEEMWAYIPNLSRAIRVSLSQKLTGQAANGDISRMRWSGDYAPKIEKEDIKMWTIFLTAKKKGLTYDKLRVWVEKATMRPIQADFLTLGGIPLKKASYSGYKMIAGKVRPTTITIQDAVKASDKSVVSIVSMETKQFPAAIFNQNSLR
jgi:outer membrane lipoprotein-sorting protein